MLADKFDSADHQEQGKKKSEGNATAKTQAQESQKKLDDQQSQSEIKEVEHMMEDQDITTDEL